MLGRRGAGLKVRQRQEGRLWLRSGAGAAGKLSWIIVLRSRTPAMSRCRCRSSHSIQEDCWGWEHASAGAFASYKSAARGGAGLCLGQSCLGLGNYLGLGLFLLPHCTALNGK